MRIPFYKYQGAGNDFVIIDQREHTYLNRTDQAIIEHLCHRRFGIGADGLMLLQPHASYDFEMIYCNADGRESSMCGNGGRCISALAHRLGIFDDRCRFLAIDGEHEAVLIGPGLVDLRMTDISSVEQGADYYYLNTGSPHYVTFTDASLDEVDVVQQGRAIRYSERFREQGTNVNFVQIRDRGIAVATYERGVEDETLACGTGVTAAAVAYHLRHPDHPTQVQVRAKGGQLEVRFQPRAGGFTEVWLSGPAEFVYEGVVEVGN